MDEIKKETNQIELWKSEFGKEYTDRNAQTLEEMEDMYLKRVAYTRTEINSEFIGSMNSSLHILEVGCNIGNQLLCLQQMGFTSLYGIDPQEYALEKAKARIQNITLKKGSAFNIPYEDGFFDLVFTSGVLIHIAPESIGNALKEIYRCSKRYIYGYEYFADKNTEIQYHGKKKALWKTNFAKLYLDNFNDLILVKEKRYPNLENEKLIDTSFLLEKIGIQN